MKKSKILAAVMLLAMFSSLFGIASVTTPAQYGSSEAPVNTPGEKSFSNNRALGENGTWVADVTAFSGGFDYTDLNDWDTLPNFAVYGGINVSIAFDGTYVYLLVNWKDTTNDSTVGQWNKTGNVNANYGAWDFLDGADDVLQVGFSTQADGSDADVMVWTYSNRTYSGYMYECDATGAPDTGNLPFLMNTNETLTFDDAQPAYEDDDMTTPLPADPTTIPNGTKVDAWHDIEDGYTPTGSQTDTEIIIDWNTTKEDHYFAWVRRELDTGQGDDLVLDFTTGDTYFWLGGANADDTYDMLIPMSSYLTCLTNDPAELTFDEDDIPRLVTESLLVTGTVWDDYAGWSLIIWMDGWEDTYGAGAYDFVSVNEATGDWSYLFLFDEWDMPLGEQTIYVQLVPLYDNAILLDNTTDIDDVEAPTIQGTVDVRSRYPDGVPVDEDYVTVTVGLQDDYASVNDVTAYLYSWKDNDVALRTQMEHFVADSTTFSANITITHTEGVTHNYTYFIEAWDTNLNKATSAKFWFLSQSIAPTPAFGIIAGLFGLAAAAFIIKKAKK